MKYTISTAVLLMALSGASGGTEEEFDPETARSVWEYLTKLYDADEDGKISKQEYTRGDEQFARLDKDGNGVIEEADVAGSSRERGSRGERGRGERGSPGERGERGERGAGRRGRGVQAPAEGDKAPGFKLETLYPDNAEKGQPEKSKPQKDKVAKKGKEDAAETYEVVELSSFKDDRPVALIFGSYT